MNGRSRNQVSMKGFVSSILALVVSALVIDLLLFYQAYDLGSNRLQQDIFAINYADYYFDDIAYDLRMLSPNNITLERTNSTSVTLGFTDSQAALDFEAAIANYSQKLSGFMQKLNINFTINTSNISTNDLAYYFSNGVVYTTSYDYPYKTYLISSPSTDFQNYTITYYTNLTRESLNDFNYQPSGDIYVKVNYTDANGTYQSEGYLNSAQSNVFKSNFANSGQFEIHIQKIGGEQGSMYIVKSDIENSTILVESLIQNNGTYEVYAIMPVFLNITHFGYSKSGYLVLLRG